MKIAIVYYSQSMNTQYAAEKIAALTGADLIRIEPKEKYRTRAFGNSSGAGKVR